MCRLTPVFLSFCFLLSACGDTPADAELARMHSAIGKRIAAVNIIERPEIAATEMMLDLSLYSAAEVLETNIHALVKAKGRYDVRKPNAPLLEQVVTLDSNALDPETKKPTGDSLQASANLRVARKTLSFNVSNFTVAAPSYLPQPFIPPAELRSRWYGATFAEINEWLGARAKESGRKAQTVEEILGSAFGAPKVTKRDLAALWSSLHLWNGTDVRVEDGLTHIDVVSDKEKIRTSVRAIVDFMRRTGGESWRRAEQTPELASQLKELTDEKSEFMKQLPVVQGTLSIDSATAELRTFTGDIMSETGAKLGSILLNLPLDGGMALMIENANHPESPLTFLQHGEEIVVKVGADTVMTGTVSKARIELTVTDSRTKKPAYKADIAIKTAAKGKLELGPSRIELAEKGIVAVVDFLKIDTTEDAMDASLSGSVQNKAKPAAVFSLTFGRRAIPAFELARPDYAPFEQFQSDTTASFLGSATDAVPSPLPK